MYKDIQFNLIVDKDSRAIIKVSSLYFLSAAFRLHKIVKQTTVRIQYEIVELMYRDLISLFQGTLHYTSEEQNAACPHAHPGLHWPYWLLADLYLWKNLIYIIWGCCSSFCECFIYPILIKESKQNCGKQTLTAAVSFPVEFQSFSKACFHMVPQGTQTRWYGKIKPPDITKPFGQKTCWLTADVGRSPTVGTNTRTVKTSVCTVSQSVYPM